MHLPKINSTVTSNQDSGIGYLYDSKFLFGFVVVSLFILFAYLVCGYWFLWYKNRGEESHTHPCGRQGCFIDRQILIDDSLFTASAPLENTKSKTVKDTIQTPVDKINSGSESSQTNGSNWL